jgi:hypothetical protein
MLASVIIDEIDVNRLPAFKTEHDAPIRAHCHRPLSFTVAFQRMEPKRRLSHVVDGAGGIPVDTQDRRAARRIAAVDTQLAVTEIVDEDEQDCSASTAPTVPALARRASVRADAAASVVPPSRM